MKPDAVATGLSKEVQHHPSQLAGHSGKSHCMNGRPSARADPLKAAAHCMCEQGVMQ